MKHNFDRPKQPERIKSYFRANIKCHRRIVSHTIPVVFHSHIVRCGCRCRCFTLSKFKPLSMLTFPLYSILSRTNHNLIPVNNVCTTAWIRTIPDKKNTCSIIQFICYMVLYMLVIKWLLFRLTNKFKLVLISMLFMLCILDNLLHSLVHWWIFSLFSHFLRRLNSQFTRFIFVIVIYIFPLLRRVLFRSVLDLS